MKKMIRTIALVLAATITLLALSACVKNNENPPETQKNVVEVVDMAGNNIVLKDYATSIFCQSSIFEQIVLALGAESTLRASSYSRTDDARNLWFQSLYPQIMDVEAAGGDKSGVTNELLVSYDLDLMLVANQDQYDEFTAIGIPCAVLDIQTLDDLLFGIEIIGKCLGGHYQEKSKNVIAYCSKLLADVKQKANQLSETDRKTAYFMESRYAAVEPTLYMTWGADSFQANCLKMAGINTVADALFAGGVRAEITTEQLLLSNPDAIVIGGFYEQTNYDALLKEENLKTLSAVENGLIYRVPVGVSEWSRIGVESFLLPVWYGTVFYPDLYKDTDVQSVVKDFYKNVMGIELSAEYQTLILSGAEGPTK